MTRIVTDPVLQRLFPSALPPTWYLRALYFSKVGVYEWLRMSSKSDYPGGSVEEDPVIRMFLKGLDKLKRVPIDLFMSLGSGDGRIDSVLLSKLRSTHTGLQYIPVDISDILLKTCLSNLSQFSQIPLAIRGDFEDGMEYLATHVERLRTGRILWSLLGNTLGSLDRGEKHFVRQLRLVAKPGDLWLVSVAMGAVRPEFLRRLGGCVISTKLGLKGTNSLESAIERIYSHVIDSEVPGSKAIEVLDSQTQIVAFTVRYYDFDRLLSWLYSEARVTVLWQSQLEGIPIGSAILRFEQPDEYP